ncbi:hypothetical protein JHW43_006649 [Diplocarpon mali]|nr:hypothetical protein JHW43_006649 [Diplocarpon mali]
MAGRRVDVESKEAEGQLEPANCEAVCNPGRAQTSLSQPFQGCEGDCRLEGVGSWTWIVWILEAEPAIRHGIEEFVSGISDQVDTMPCWEQEAIPIRRLFRPRLDINTVSEDLCSSEGMCIANAWGVSHGMLYSRASSGQTAPRRLCLLRGALRLFESMRGTSCGEGRHVVSTAGCAGTRAQARSLNRTQAVGAAYCRNSRALNQVQVTSQASQAQASHSLPSMTRMAGGCTSCDPLGDLTSEGLSRSLSAVAVSAYLASQSGSGAPNRGGRLFTAGRRPTHPPSGFRSCPPDTSPALSGFRWGAAGFLVGPKPWHRYVCPPVQAIGRDEQSTSRTRSPSSLKNSMRRYIAQAQSSVSTGPDLVLVVFSFEVQVQVQVLRHRVRLCGSGCRGGYRRREGRVRQDSSMEDRVFTADQGILSGIVLIYLEPDGFKSIQILVIHILILPGSDRASRSRTGATLFDALARLGWHRGASISRALGAWCLVLGASWPFSSHGCDVPGHPGTAECHCVKFREEWVPCRRDGSGSFSPLALGGEEEEEAEEEEEEEEEEVGTSLVARRKEARHVTL